jgi:hypothetical protein
MAERSTKGMWQSLGYGLAALMVGAGGYLGGLAHNEHPADPPRTTSQRAITPPPPPLGEPDPTPTTDDGVIASRALELKLNPLIVQLTTRAALAEARTCLLEQELRALYARHVALAGGKHGAVDRKAFESDTIGWAACFHTLDEINQRKSLREAADSVLLK